MSDEADERERIERAIVAQEGLRETIGDEAVEVTLSALRERLAAIGSTDQRRRQATVLFADVSGFTSLAETLDAEIVTEIINEVWRRLDAVLRQHGAHIDKHIGDAVMALWGADATREGDPERAVRALSSSSGSLRLSATSRARRPDARRRHHRPRAVRCRRHDPRVHGDG